jgi:hypothetical protein
LPAIPKPQHKRRRRKRGQLSKITERVSKEVMRRSNECCERCGVNRNGAYALERAHLINASQLGSGREPWNVALLCGPKVNTGTCHQWADETREGREWKQRKRKELLQQYNPSDWT